MCSSSSSDSGSRRSSRSRHRRAGHGSGRTGSRAARACPRPSSVRPPRSAPPRRRASRFVGMGVEPDAALPPAITTESPMRAASRRSRRDRCRPLRARPRCSSGRGSHRACGRRPRPRLLRGASGMAPRPPRAGTARCPRAIDEALGSRVHDSGLLQSLHLLRRVLPRPLGLAQGFGRRWAKSRTSWARSATCAPVANDRQIVPRPLRDCAVGGLGGALHRRGEVGRRVRGGRAGLGETVKNGPGSLRSCRAPLQPPRPPGHATSCAGSALAGARSLSHFLKGRRDVVPVSPSGTGRR